jgi:hypothetical protein
MTDKRLDIMYIPMTKQEENSDYVWYKFGVKIYELDHKVLSVELNEWHYGIIKFKKAGSLSSPMYEIIKEKTSPDLLKNKSFEHIIWGCLYELVKCKRNNMYPESMAYQCG